MTLLLTSTVSTESEARRYYENRLMSNVNEIETVTLASNSTGLSIPLRSSHKDLIWFLTLYLTPMIILVGLIGNLLSFCVFMCTHQKRLSSSVFLAALAVADTCFLLTNFGSWLGYVRIFLIHKQGWCQLSVYLPYVSSFLSVWYVVGFTVERYIAVCHPLHRRGMCTVLRAKLVVTFLAVLALVMYCYTIFTSGIIQKQCMPLWKYMHVLPYLVLVDSLLTFVIPCATIFCLNIRIILKITYFFQRRQSMASFVECVPSECGQARALPRDTRVQIRSTRANSQMKTTKMLLVVSSMFLLLHMPSHTVRLYFLITSLVSPSYAPPETLAQTQRMFEILYHLNFAVNFFLYSFCGQNFRTALKSLFRQMRNGSCWATNEAGKTLRMEELNGRCPAGQCTNNGGLKSDIEQTAISQLN